MESLSASTGSADFSSPRNRKNSPSLCLAFIHDRERFVERRAGLVKMESLQVCLRKRAEADDNNNAPGTRLGESSGLRLAWLGPARARSP